VPSTRPAATQPGFLPRCSHAGKPASAAACVKTSSDSAGCGTDSRLARPVDIKLKKAGSVGPAAASITHTCGGRADKEQLGWQRQLVRLHQVAAMC